MNFKKSAVVGGLVFLAGCSAVSQRTGEIARDGSRDLKNLGTRLNPPAYKTNASDALSARKFGDDYFNSRKSVTNIDGTEYVWMPLAGKNVEVEGKVLAQEEYFPFAAFKRNEMLVRVNPQTREITYGYEDKSAIVFVKDSSIKHVTTNFTGNPSGRAEKNKIIHTSEPGFSVPLINFGVEGLRNVAYGLDGNNDKQFILIPSPEYGVNKNRGGVIQYFPTQGAFIAKIGELSLKPIEPKTVPKETPSLEVTVERVQITPQTETVQAAEDPNQVDPNQAADPNQ